MYRIIASCFIAVSLLACGSAKKNNPTKSNSEPYLVVLSLDGFRWDYASMYSTPNLDAIAKSGVKAKSLMPSFPSKTFPNHYTIATGLYPGNHGIVQNTFKDSVLGEYTLSNREAVTNGKFYGGEPIWVSAEKQDVKAACYFWPGSEAAIQGVRPSIWKEYSKQPSYEARADSILSWLQKPQAERPHLLMWYFDEPDHTGHRYGPQSAEVEVMVQHVDSVIGQFYAKLSKLPMADSVNFVIVSDHGMEAVSQERCVSISDYINKDWLAEVQGWNPNFLIQPKAGYEQQVWEALLKVPHMATYKKSELPARYHYTKSNRVYDFVCVADSSWSIHWDESTYANGGAHGYDPQNTDVHAIFYATGPAFKQGVEMPSFENVDLYSLFAKILAIEPAPTDGSIDALNEILKK